VPGPAGTALQIYLRTTTRNSRHSTAVYNHRLTCPTLTYRERLLPVAEPIGLPIVPPPSA